MKYRRLLSAFFIFLSPVLSHAEYRVFVLKISKRAPAGAAANASAEGDQGFRLVESTLDHVQYRYFYPVAADEEVTYIDTWRCYGRTGGMTPHCPNPKGQIPSSDSPAP
ncbi:hypothetical protein [Bdellovibrio sp. KM01]|uniref:hypothetical protein n=1 Tax=Bdellovibrio sp. KM01 TaxID=2748865 RepID=UPI0015E99E17|nr:hypothetical protein [Bdellovibrio sp. KM01]QLY24383.1 hypothetical protein HW988_13045 [Bdellovibrio sp. KM01]